MKFNEPKKNSPNTKDRGQARVANAASRSQSDAAAAAAAATHSALTISPNEPSQYQTHQTFDSQQSRFAIENNQTHASANVYSQAKKHTCPGGTALVAQPAVIHFPASVPAPAKFWPTDRFEDDNMTATALIAKNATAYAMQRVCTGVINAVQQDLDTTAGGNVQMIEGVPESIYDTLTDLQRSLQRDAHNGGDLLELFEIETNNVETELIEAIDLMTAAFAIMLREELSLENSSLALPMTMMPAMPPPVSFETPDDLQVPLLMLAPVPMHDDNMFSLCRWKRLNWHCDTSVSLWVSLFCQQTTLVMSQTNSSAASRSPWPTQVMPAATLDTSGSHANSTPIYPLRIANSQQTLIISTGEPECAKTPGVK